MAQHLVEVLPWLGRAGAGVVVLIGPDHPPAACLGQRQAVLALALDGAALLRRRRAEFAK
jgi:hypothetical protein